MEISDSLKKTFVKRLILSRMRLLCSHPFFGLLLMNVKFRLDENVQTAATDGENIVFGVDFLQELSDGELDFVLMHEIMHVCLKHCWRGKGLLPKTYNIACDIVVNSNILHENNGNISSITLKKYGVSMHLAPDGKEGYNYTAEEVYEMLPKWQSGKSKSSSPGKGSQSGKSNGQKTDDSQNEGFDDHSKWDEHCEENSELCEEWVKRMEDCAKAIEIREAICGRGLLPLFAKRMLAELKEPTLDWRTILADFISEEVVDYSFTPPDRRLDGGDFFLPDFNGTDIKVEKILFMIDTSGSMSDDMITRMYSEVKGSIDQFDGKLQGYLGFFDAAIVEPKPFVDEDSFKVIKPVGGGGTRFDIIFKYVYEQMSDDLPVSIIILTDGYAPFPPEKEARSIPVLWVINNEKVNPPWGKVARVSK